MNFDDSGADPDFGDAYAVSERENANPNVIISGKRHTYILFGVLTRSLFLNTNHLFLIQKQKQVINAQGVLQVRHQARTCS